MITAIDYLTNAALIELSALERFRFRAVVDWLSIGIETARPTNFWSIQDHLRRALDIRKGPYVRALNEGRGRSATRYTLRVHDPEKHADVQELIARLRTKFMLCAEPWLDALEVSIDGYSRRNSVEEREALVMRQKLSLCADGPKMLECGMQSEAIINMKTLRSDRTLLIEAHDIKWRVYHKVTDHNQRAIADERTHRSRTEVALSGDMLPADLRSVGDLAFFKFEALAPHFSFREFTIRPTLPFAPPTTVPELLERCSTELLLGRGHRDLPDPAPAERRKYPKGTRADSEMKERVRGSLRDLTRRFGAKKPVKNGLVAIDPANESRPALIT